MSLAPWSGRQAWVRPSCRYTGVEDDETVRSVAERIGADAADIVFLNAVLYGGEGLTPSSKLREGTPLRVPSGQVSVPLPLCTSRDG